MSMVRKKDDSIEIDLLEVLKLLARNLWIIVIAAIVGAAVFFGASYLFIG